MKKNCGGFTLVELLATIACASIVTLAAMSFLTVCFRMWVSARNTASRQETARIVLTFLEELAGDGSVSKAQHLDDGGWALLGGEDVGSSVLLYYSESGNALYTGGTYSADGSSADGANGITGGSLLMEGVTDFEVQYNSPGLLTVSLTAGEDTYTTSVYCRTSMQGDDWDNSETVERFLQVLLSQVGSEGQIIYTDGDGPVSKPGSNPPQYFSEWYIGTENFTGGWNANTPWCACFVSWGIDQVHQQSPETFSYTGGLPKFAGVDSGVRGFGGGDGDGEGPYGKWLDPGGTDPQPGDLIFFDWEAQKNPKENENDRADHVGVVLAAQGGWVYTVEGNSGGRVAIRGYALNDSRIMGYGQLSWKTENTEDTVTNQQDAGSNI